MSALSIHIIDHKRAEIIGIQNVMIGMVTLQQRVPILKQREAIKIITYVLFIHIIDHKRAGTVGIQNVMLGMVTF